MSGPIFVDKHEDKKIRAAEMTFLWRVEGCTQSDLIRHEDVRNCQTDRIVKYKKMWRQHVNRLEKDKIPRKLKTIIWGGGVRLIKEKGSGGRKFLVRSSEGDKLILEVSMMIIMGINMLKPLNFGPNYYH